MVITIFCCIDFITFCVSRRRRKIYCGHARLCVCVSVCVSVCLSAAVRPHYCTDPDVTWGHGRGCPLAVHYWADLQSGHGLRCYGNITRTLVTSLRPSRDMATYCKRLAGRGLRAAGRRPAGDGGCAPKTARRIQEEGAAGPPATGRGRGAFSTLLRRPGLQASSDGVLATKSERKMLASTSLYSLYAWLLSSSSFIIIIGLLHA